MIHKAAADAVGEVLINGELNGHCVLIAPHMAVTCAHVLTRMPSKPDVTAHLRFPRLNFRTTATITGWNAYDDTLSAGSDIALLALEDEAPANSWRFLEPARPSRDAAVVALDYLTGRYDGDAREATVTQHEGSVISLTGNQIIEAGMSGTGLFYRDHGERLLGILSAKVQPNRQPKAYMIPADEICRLQASCVDKPVANTSLALFEALTENFLAQVGDNHRPDMREFVEAARDVIDKPAEEWTECDIQDLLDLNLEIGEGNGGGIALPTGIAEMLNRLAELTAERARDALDCATRFPVDDGDIRTLEDLQQRLGDFLQSPECPEQATQPAKALLRNIRMAIARQKMRPLQLSNCNANLQAAAGKAYRGLGRVMPALLGRRADLLPPRTIFTDSLEPWAPEMVVIPTGRFLMGSPEDEEDRKVLEGPQHEVTIDRPFALARFALTFEEYVLFCEETGLEKPDVLGWSHDRHPAINVSWKDAQVWCAWIRAQTGAEWRLPSEAEWEYACRAGATTRYSFGDTVTTAQAHFDGGDDGSEFRARTVPVDHPEFSPNGFHLWQMHGNVWEWCEDDWTNNYTTPCSQAAILVDPRRDGRVVRGGSWNNYPEDLRSASRHRNVPIVRRNFLGFRPARALLPL